MNIWYAAGPDSPNAPWQTEQGRYEEQEAPQGVFYTLLPGGGAAAVVVVHQLLFWSSGLSYTAELCDDSQQWPKAMEEFPF